MALLRPKLVQTRRRVFRARTVLRCPLNGHQVGWCRGLCEPINECGVCGRLAPHAMTSRTQAAIASYRDRPLKSVT